MARKYSKRTKSTKAKTYDDYLADREKILKHGIELKDELSEESFNEYYKRLRDAKKAGEIKSQPYQELMRRDRYISRKQANVMAKAASIMEGRTVTAQQIARYSRTQIAAIGAYINMTKSSGIYGGDYE